MERPMHTLVKWAGLASLAALASCDYSGDFLFAGESLDDIWILEAEGGGDIVPATITTVDELRAATIYAEVGAPTTTAYGGVTFEFLGTGGDVCLWVDPEIAYWSQSIALRPTADAEKWSYPDNVFDDGDIDLFAGLSVYYTGSPGIEIGDFEVQYEDSLGNQVPISLAACPNTISFNEVAVSAGRGSPEYCTIQGTDIGIGYTVLLRTWSTPLDDDRLSFGLVVADGDCESLRTLAGASTRTADECLVQGEALTPEGDVVGPYYGFEAINEQGRIWPGSTEFEAAFCDSETLMRQYCRSEANALDDAGLQCEWNDAPTTDNRCYCGNPDDTPNPGAL
jgi:hypothetical protein